MKVRKKKLKTAKFPRPRQKKKILPKKQIQGCIFYTKTIFYPSTKGEINFYPSKLIAFRLKRGKRLIQCTMGLRRITNLCAREARQTYFKNLLLILPFLDKET